MTLDRAAESCRDILGISSEKAHDLSLFAKHQGFSRLGTWTREECLTLGEELVSRDLDCRVIPFNGGAVPERVSEITVAVTDTPPHIAIVDDMYSLSFSNFN